MSRMCAKLLRPHSAQGLTLSGIWGSGLFRDSFRTLPGFRARRARETLRRAELILSFKGMSPISRNAGRALFIKHVHGKVTALRRSVTPQICIVPVITKIFRKILVSVKFVSAILGPEMAAPILWTPGKMHSFCRKNHVRKIPLFWGWFWGGGSADFIFMGARIFLKYGSHDAMHVHTGSHENNENHEIQ